MCPWSAQFQTVHKSVSQIWLARIRRGLGRKRPVLNWGDYHPCISWSSNQPNGWPQSQLLNKYKQATAHLSRLKCVCVCVLWGLLDSDGVIMMMMLHWTIISAPHCEDSGSISQLGGVFVCAVSVVLPTVQLTHWGHLDAPVYLRWLYMVHVRHYGDQSGCSSMCSSPGGLGSRTKKTHSSTHGESFSVKYRMWFF